VQWSIRVTGRFDPPTDPAPGDTEIEIEVTAAMFAAGCRELALFNPDFDRPEVGVERIFLAMLDAGPE
jgi:hypothetical protein